MKTAKVLGFKKGDFVHTGVFPAIIVGQAHTTTPLCEVWGVEHESGSAYASDLHLMTYEAWFPLAKAYGFDGTAYAQVAKDAIRAAVRQASPEDQERVLGGFNRAAPGDYQR